MRALTNLPQKFATKSDFNANGVHIPFSRTTITHLVECISHMAVAVIAAESVLKSRDNVD